LNQDISTLIEDFVNQNCVIVCEHKWYHLYCVFIYNHAFVIKNSVNTEMS